MKNKKTLWLLVCAGIVLIVIIVSILGFRNTKKKEVVTIGVILPGSSSEMGWNGIHYAGVKEACDSLGVKIELYENVAEYSGKCETAVRELADKGISLIILESYNYPFEIEDVINEYPDIVFYCCSSDVKCPNLKQYFARVYQARYLSGIVAGMTTETNHIGYVAAMNNNEVNRGINAFALGVQRVNPQAVVHVSYTESWDDETKEKELTQVLIEECQADVITYHQNQPFVVEMAESLGVDVIGYNLETSDFSEHLLTSVVSNWEMVYREVIEDYLRKKDVGNKDYWIGIEKSAVGLAFYSDKVPQEIKDAVDRATNELCNGKEIFSGLIYDNKGRIRSNDNQVIRDEELLNYMDWLVRGVEVYERK